jgi:hypothetical protein
MSTPQENDSLQQDAQMPPDMGEAKVVQGQRQDDTQQQIDQLRRVSDQDEIAKQNLDAVSGTPTGQVPGIVSGNDDHDAASLADDDDDKLDDADDTDTMTAADMAGQG